MKKITLIILAFMFLTGCTDAKKNAFNLAKEKLDSMYTIRSFDAYDADNVNLIDIDEDPNEHFYSVQVFYEAKTNAGTVNTFSSKCYVPKNATSYISVSCFDD